MQVLLEAGADENSADPRSQVPLHFAAKHGQIATLQMLLYAWTGHKIANWSGTPMHLAASQEFETTVKVHRASPTQSPANSVCM